MHNKNKGRISVQFTPETNQEITEWSHSIKDEDLVTVNINGKTKGGLVVDKLHLTLLYGLNNEMINVNELFKSLKKIKLKKIKISGIEFFSSKEYNCNILHLKIEDNGDELKKINKDLKKFPVFSKYKKFEYIPHITIAYVKRDFNLAVLIQKLPKILYVHSVQYFTSPTSK